MSPNFIGIGSQKCATSYLYKVLSNYPSIYLSKPKELNFFSKPSTKTISEYLAYFDNEILSVIQARGEISPQYSRLGVSRIKAIKQLFPELKLILLIRHPIQRAWSGACYEFGFIENKRLDSISDFEFMLRLSRPRTYLYSDYYRTIQNWKTVFGKEALLICLQENIEKDPHTFIETILKHLTIENLDSLAPESDYLRRKVGTTERKTKQKPLGMRI
jgi:hypothetical protein